MSYKMANDQQTYSIVSVARKNDSHMQVREELGFED
jgi:hypothetical protein